MALAVRAILLGQIGKQINGIADAGAQVERMGFEFDAAGFDLRKI